MSKLNGKTETLLSRVALSGLALIAVSAMSIGTASAQNIITKFDRNKLNLNSDAVQASEGLPKALTEPQQIQSANTKSDREEGGSGKKVFPRVAIGKGDREENETRNQQIVIGKGDQTEESEPPKKRQVIVEPRPKKIVEAEPVFVAKPKKKVVQAAKPKKTVLAAVEEPKVVADAAPAEEAPAVTEEEAPAAEAPAEETASEQQAETPAEPKQTFEVGQIVTAADGNQYIVVKVNEASVSVYPLSAYVAEEPVQKVYKKKRHKKRYSSYGYSRKRSYGGYSGCH